MEAVPGSSKSVNESEYSKAMLKDHFGASDLFVDKIVSKLRGPVGLAAAFDKLILGYAIQRFTPTEGANHSQIIRYEMRLLAR